MKGNVKLYCELCSGIKLKPGYTSNDIFKILNNYDISAPITSTVNSAIKRFIEAKKCEDLSKCTIGSYNCALNQFSKWCIKNKLDLNSIKKEDIKFYLSYLNESLKESSVMYHLSVIKIFFSWLEVEYIMEKNPAKGISFKGKKGIRKALSEKDVKSIIKACKTTRETALINFLLDTGCRVSEVINIRTTDVDFNQNQVSVTGKGNKQRTVLFTNKTKELLQNNIKESKNKEYLFSACKHPFHKMERFAINALIKKIAERAKIVAKVHPHIFRHTFATTALAKGMNLVMIQRLLGHENLSTTQVYIDVDMNSIKREYNKLFN